MTNTQRCPFLVKKHVEEKSGLAIWSAICIHVLVFCRGQMHPASSLLSLSQLWCCCLAGVLEIRGTHVWPIEGSVRSSGFSLVADVVVLLSTSSCSALEDGASSSRFGRLFQRFAGLDPDLAEADLPTSRTSAVARQTTGQPHTT